MVEKTCVICGKSMYARLSHLRRGWGKYCSKKCQFSGQRKGKWVSCEHCGQLVYRNPTDHKKSKSKLFFCSRKCHCTWENENVRCGVKAPNWMAGHSVYRKLLRRAHVKEECEKCGIKDKRVLIVHHKDSNRKNNSVENLEWLCRNCHCIVHSN